MTEEINSADSDKYDEIDYTHEDRPDETANDLAQTPEFVENVIGAYQQASQTPKGYPEGHSMPALFGWITPDYQRQIAQELENPDQDNYD